MRSRANQPSIFGCIAATGPAVAPVANQSIKVFSLGGTRPRPHVGQDLTQSWQFVRQDHRIGKPGIDRIGAIHGLASEAKMSTDFARRAPRQQQPGADIGKVLVDSVCSRLF